MKRSYVEANPAPSADTPRTDDSVRLSERLSWVAVAVGAILYLAHYAGGRSLWLDEVMLALNIKLLTYPELAGRLDYDQLAPVGWLWLEKVFYTATGSLEYGLRLAPVAAAVASLVLFRQLAFKMLTGFGALAAVSIFASSGALVRFAAEAKPYSLDVMLGIAAMLAAVSLISESPPKPWRFAVFALIGFVAVTTSFSAVYVLAACGAVVFLKFILHRRWVSAGAVSLISLGWLLLFLFLLVRVYLPQTADSELVEGGSAQFFNRTSYAPFPPTSVKDLVWYAVWAKSFLLFLFRAEALFPAFALLLVGLVALTRNRWWVLVLAAAPLALALIASSFKVYPLYERLALFAAPGLILVAGGGAEWLFKTARRTMIAPGVIVALVMAGSAPYIFGNLFKVKPPFAQHEVRHALKALQAKVKPDDVIYVTNNTIPAYLLYRNEYGLRDHSWIAGRTPWVGWTCYLQDIPTSDAPQRIWVVATTYAYAEILGNPTASDLAIRGRMGTTTLEKRVEQAWLYRADTQPLPGWVDIPHPQSSCGLDDVNNRFDVPKRIRERLGF